jgi:phosphonate transport system permease protein
MWNAPPPADRAGARGVAARALPWVVLLSAVVLSFRAAEVHPLALFSGSARRGLIDFGRQLFPPALDASFLGVALRASLRTLSIAVSGTALSIAIGLPLGFLATPTLFRRGVLVAAGERGTAFALLAAASLFSRALLRFLRAVPDLLWALVFVVAFGLGPLPGALALGFSYAGVIGRVFADLFEEAPPLPIESLHAAGGSRLQIFLLGIWPQTAPGVLAYSLYSFECCVRAAMVLGFIGAGGIGYEIAVSMRLYQYGQVTTLLAIFLILIAATDWLSRTLRRRFRRVAEITREPRTLRRRIHFMQPGPSAEAMAHARPFRRWLRAALAPLVAAVVLASLAEAGFFAVGSAGGSSSTIVRVLRFAGHLVPPDLSADFLRSLAEPLAQTLGISVVGTLIGLVVGGALALLATSVLIFPPAEDPARRSAVGLALRTAAWAASHAVLALLRSIPELLWVLFCIIAVGLGPFAGTLALGLHTAGVVGKLFAETLEEVPERALLGLRACGATPLQILCWGLWPQARGTLATYAMLRWENNLRVSTVVGLVGGGGLGFAIYNSVQLGFYPRVATLILLVYALVAGTDWISDRVRSRGRGLDAAAQPAAPRLGEMEAGQA